MGKGNKKEEEKRKRQSEPEEEPEEEEVEEDVEGEYDDDEIDYFDEDISDNDASLLNKIQEEIIAAAQPYKLSWAAIHNLKKKEKEIHEEMDKELREIQAKYDLLKKPIAEKIAKVASGHPVEKQLYTQHEYTKTLNVNKHKPSGIPGYWRGVLESMGFIDS